MKIFIFVKLTNYFQRIPIFDVLIKKLDLKLSKVDQPDVMDFPDMANPDWFIDGSSTIETRVVLSFYFETHCTTNLEQNYPESLLL